MCAQITEVMMIAMGAGAGAAQAVADPNLWLELWTAPRVMRWVEADNARSLAELEADPRFHAQAVRPG